MATISTNRNITACIPYTEVRRLIVLKWFESRNNYPDKWLLFEAIEAYSKLIIEERNWIGVRKYG